MGCLLFLEKATHMDIFRSLCCLFCKGRLPFLLNLLFAGMARDSSVFCFDFYKTDCQSPSFSEAATAAKHTTSTSDNRVLNLALDWLEECRSHPKHSYCREALGRAGAFPTRLIDVCPDGTADDYWRLVEDTGTLSGHYLTLSHRWGTGTIKLSRSTHGDMLSGMSVSVLSATYQDAIRVTRHLKVRYLWIDSICIFQDETLDIQKEAVRCLNMFSLHPLPQRDMQLSL